MYDHTTWDCVKGTILMSLLRWDRNGKFSSPPSEGHLQKLVDQSHLHCNWYFAKPQEYLRYKQNGLQIVTYMVNA